MQDTTQAADSPWAQRNIIRVEKDVMLREVGEEDAHELFALVDANRIYLREWLPWLDQNRSVNDSLVFLRSTQLQRRRLESLTFGIRIALDASPDGSGRLAGVIAIRSLDHINRSGEIGYWVAGPLQGKGIATMACRAIVDFGFRRLNLHRIVIRCATGNRRSCRIPDRLGFRFEGITRDGEFLYDHFVDLNVYATLSHHWKERGTSR